MTDVFSEEKRSDVMSKIKGSGNKETEIALISIFRKYKITGWRRKQRIFGKPDFVFWKQRVVVFVDGCFWHQCPFHSKLPKQHQEFWQKKLSANIARDQTVNVYLKKKGWTVLRVWEHDLKEENRIHELFMSLLNKDNL